MGIIKTTKETEEYINSFMENQKESENSGPAVSNYQLSSTVALYKQMLESENGSICQFASNGGGFTSYHYYKKNDKIYLIECYMQKIQSYYVVSEKWLFTQKDYLERFHHNPEEVLA